MTLRRRPTMMTRLLRRLTMMTLRPLLRLRLRLRLRRLLLRRLRLRLRLRRLLPLPLPLPLRPRLLLRLTMMMTLRPRLLRLTMMTLRRARFRSEVNLLNIWKHSERERAEEKEKKDVMGETFIHLSPCPLTHFDFIHFL